MVKRSLYKTERWRKRRTREVDFAPRINMCSGASFVTSTNFSFLNHKLGDNIYLPGCCQHQLIKMYVREPSTGLSERLGIVRVFHHFHTCPWGASSYFYRSYLFFPVYTGRECWCSPTPWAHRRFTLPCPLAVRQRHMTCSDPQAVQGKGCVSF